MSRGEGALGSRRRFLQTTVGVGAGLAGWSVVGHGGKAAAAPSTRDAALAEPGPRDPGLRRQNFRPWRDDADIAGAIAQSLRCIIATGVDANLPRPFELDRLARNAKLRRDVAAICLDCMSDPAALRRHVTPLYTTIVPKVSMFGYRRCAHAEPISAVLYLACAILIAERVEPARSPVGAQKLFSFRFKPAAGAIFDDAWNYAAFRDRTVAKLDPRDRLFLVDADIANFYPSIDNARLFVTLQRCGVEPPLADLLRSILSQWQGQWQSGLPVGPAASSFLAEAALIDVDRRLEADGIDFVRYVDDYRLFAPDATVARRWLERLIEQLAAEGLNLNSAKTSIVAVTRSEYLEHLNIRRAARYWGGLRPTDSEEIFAQATPNDEKPNEKPTEKADGSPQKNGKDHKEETKPESPPIVPFVPGPYGDTPFNKTQLSAFDLAVLRDVEPARALSSLATRLARGEHVSLGQFRVFAEAACHRGEHALLGDAVNIANHCRHLIPYLVNILIAQREHIPAAVRAAAANGFAARLAATGCASDFELIHVAMLLGAEGYRRPQALVAYLQSSWRALSPIVIRAFVGALRGQGTRERAEAIVEVGLHGDPIVRRAIFDWAWPALDPTRQAALVEACGADFRGDPFLSHLGGSGSASVQPLVRTDAEIG